VKPVKEPTRKSIWRRIYDERSAYLLLLPNLVFFAAFVWLPIFFSFSLSFYRYGLSKARFVGLRNYINLADDPRIWLALKNTLHYAALMVPACIVAGLGIALLLNNPKIRGRSAFRLAALIPYVVPLATISLVWTWLYEPNWGLFNRILGTIGMKPRLWLSDVKLALPSITVVETWKRVGYYMILFLAGLQTIPLEYYEAARLEGAGPVASFFHVTLPLLSHTTFFIVIIATIQAFKIFTSVYIMTGGGPADSTQSLVTMIYETGFGYFKMGYASAIAMLLLAVLLVIILVQVKFLQTETEYE
jgi:ABC-type sugar transport system permease subunit